MMLGKKTEVSTAAPGWVVTYADFVTVLLCFFIALASMGEIKTDRFRLAAQSLQGAFGGLGATLGTTPVEVNTKKPLIDRLMGLETRGKSESKEVSNDEGAAGRAFRVTSVRQGLQVDVGGRIAFDRFDAELLPEARELVAKTSEMLRGYSTKIVIRGHAAKESLPAQARYRNARDLSYARARAVAEVLEKNGIRPERIQVLAVGDGEPLARQAFTDEGRAADRRIEILVTEDLVDDYQGTTRADDVKGSSDGG